jgi:hypothetical protein
MQHTPRWRSKPILRPVYGHISAPPCAVRGRATIEVVPQQLEAAAANLCSAPDISRDDISIDRSIWDPVSEFRAHVLGWVLEGAFVDYCVERGVGAVLWERNGCTSDEETQYEADNNLRFFS